MKKTKLSIIIPVYNEEATIGRVIDRVQSVKLEGIVKEIVVVDDGSTDKRFKNKTFKTHSMLLGPKLSL